MNCEHSSVQARPDRSSRHVDLVGVTLLRAGQGSRPLYPREEYPWFWDGGTFKGDRVNDRHDRDVENQAVREADRVTVHHQGPGIWLIRLKRTPSTA